LNKTDDGVHQNNNEDNGRSFDLPSNHQTDDGGSNQDDGEKVRKLSKETLPRWRWWRFGKAVWAE
jgi:hypothetical protein